MDMKKVITVAHIEQSKTFSIRVPVNTLEAFKKACKDNHSNASRTLEALMKEYIRETERMTMTMTKRPTVVNGAGVTIDYEEAVNYMDRGICEYLHSKMAPCTDQEFFDAYVKEHEKKFGEEFELNKENPVA